MPPPPNQQPNFHFLFIAPNLGAEWFFDAARQYWERFRPTVISDYELARLIPPQFSVIVTVIARRDNAARWGVLLSQVLPDALFDPVVRDFFEDMRIALNDRAALYQPFGVPMLPTPTPPPYISPTPGAVVGGGTEPTAAPPTAIPTRGPAGFVTLAPPDTGAPVQPTPGPVTGGG